MPYDGRAVANCVLDVAEGNRIKLSNLALQKVLFFCQAWHLVDTNEALINTQFEAWQHGPVLQYIYRQFKKFEASPISGRATGLDPNSGQQKIIVEDFPKDVLERIEKVVTFYGRLEPWDLVDLSHAKGGPWDNVWHHEGKVNPGMKIPNNEIASFYSRAIPQHGVQ